MTVRDIGRDYRWTPDRSRDRLSGNALACLVLGLACLVIARFYPVSHSIARAAESLGWIALVGATAVLFVDWRRRNRVPGAGPSFKSRSRTKAINRLYDELRPLMDRALRDPSLKGEVDAKLALLRKLQTEEAKEMRRRFEAGLLLTPEEAQQALDRAKALIARYGTPASPDSSIRS